MTAEGLGVGVPLATRLRDQLREIVISIRSQYLIHVWHIELGQGTTISLSAKIDKTNPRGLHIGLVWAVSVGRSSH